MCLVRIISGSLQKYNQHHQYCEDLLIIYHNIHFHILTVNPLAYQFFIVNCFSKIINQISLLNVLPLF